MSDVLGPSPLGEEARSQTNHYYDRNARAYSASTISLDMSKLYDRFLKHLPPRGRILDAGCGSGRDILAFKRRGYEVEAFDSSENLCALAGELTGIQPRVMCFQAFQSNETYDGIWACASLLHVASKDLGRVIKALSGSLAPGGVMYVSFKFGRGERYSEDGRFYLDMDESALREILADLPDLRLSDEWISLGEGKREGSDHWLNAIIAKKKD